MLEWRLTRRGDVIASGAAPEREAWRQAALEAIALTPDRRDWPEVETRRAGCDWVVNREMDYVSIGS